MRQLPTSNFDYKEFSPNCLIIEKVVTPVHFRSLRIWPMPHCSLINSPLSPWTFKPTIQLPIITPTYYSVLWYHSFYVFCLRSLLLTLIYLTKHSYPSSKPSSDLPPPTSSPWPSQQKELIIPLFSHQALNLLQLICGFYHITNHLFTSSPLL